VRLLVESGRGLDRHPPQVGVGDSGTDAARLPGTVTSHEPDTALGLAAGARCELWQALPEEEFSEVGEGDIR
jgi:hypothetical protein